MYFNLSLCYFQPTWTFMAPALATSLVPVITPDHLSSLETLVLLGAPSTAELLDALRVHDALSRIWIFAVIFLLSKNLVTEIW